MEVYVARQPIFKKNKKLFAYELLFRGGLANAFPNIDGDTATSKLLSNSFFTIGIESITRGKLAFVNFTERLLLNKAPLLFPKDKIVVEILEGIQPGVPLVRACREMAEKGYKLALDDFSYRPEWEDIVAIANIIKLDFRAMNLGEIGEIVKKLTPYGSSFLAEKVETYDEFQKAQELGFDSFQGYFFSKPEILRGTEISGSRLSLLQIMAEANKQDLEFSKLEKLIGRDVAISYKLLRYINSAYFKRATNISSIGQAIVLLGEKQIRQFISLVAMSGLAADKPDELIRASIVRAKFCELLSEAGGGKKDSSELFTLGLFSYIDAILDESMENLMKTLPLSEAIKEALVYSRGELNGYLSVAQSYDRGDWSSVSAMSPLLALQEESLPALFAEAVRWADSFSDLK